VTARLGSALLFSQKPSFQEHTMQYRKALAAFFSSIFLTLATSGAALAHTGGDGGSHHNSWMESLSDGLLHPLTGTDHLAAMLAVGIWSAVALRGLWQAPLAFVVMLTVGALAGFGGFEPAGIEPMIAASLLVLGLLIATRQRLALAAAVALVGVFAFFHGLAHGVELAAGERIAALAGMVIGTAGLHLTGLGLGHFILKHQHALQRVVGAGVVVLGGYTLTQVL
jgi:urease accessory protein